jgi:hypothetical protein
MKYFTVNLVKLPGIQVRLLLNSEVKFTEHLSIFTVQLNTTHNYVLSTCRYATMHILLLCIDCFDDGQLKSSLTGS